MKYQFFLKPTVILLSSASMAFGTTITFDDLSAGISGSGNYPALANGYGGLNWNNFSAVDGTDSATASGGNHSGVVSSKNIAFNGFGSPASISGSAFNLTSGYFTALWSDNLQLEVKGYVGATLTYDNSYTLSTLGPLLINFNFLGVDLVQFVSSGGTPNTAYTGSGTHFGLDNLTINGGNTVPDAAATGLMLSTALLGLAVLRKKLV